MKNKKCSVFFNKHFISFQAVFRTKRKSVFRRKTVIYTINDTTAQIVLPSGTQTVGAGTYEIWVWYISLSITYAAADFRCNNKFSLSGDFNSAHTVKQPFADGALTVMVKRRYSSLRFHSFPTLPNRPTYSVKRTTRNTSKSMPTEQEWATKNL